MMDSQKKLTEDEIANLVSPESSSYDEKFKKELNSYREAFAQEFESASAERADVVKTVEAAFSTALPDIGLQLIHIALHGEKEANRLKAQTYVLDRMAPITPADSAFSKVLERITSDGDVTE